MPPDRRPACARCTTLDGFRVPADIRVPSGFEYGGKPLCAACAYHLFGDTFAAALTAAERRAA